MPPLLQLHDVSCGYRDHAVLDGLSLQVREGQICCLLGPSGCGKTTALRAIAGFEPISRGEILIQGQCLSRPGLTLPPEGRRLGMVFQDYALFPHLNTADNVAFGLRGQSPSQRRRAADRLLELVGLSGYGSRYPHELSGGQQQRVALARALAPRPRLLLLDEPFSNLDVELRERLALDIRRVLEQQGTAAVFVTHDQHEAFLLGERIGVMHQGRLLQWDTPYALYHEPKNRFVADFIGQGRFLPGVLIEPDQVSTELGILRGNIAYNLPRGREVEVLLRPDDLIMGAEGQTRGEITDKAFKGAETLYTLRLPSGAEVLSLAPSHHDYEVGSTLPVAFDGDHVILFEREG